MTYIVVSVEKKRKNYSGHFQFGNEIIKLSLSEELILDYRIVKGKELTPETFESLKEQINFDLYRQKLIYYATYKPRTIKEANQYLNKFDMPNDIKEKYLQKLIENRILDDEIYAKNYIDEYSHYRQIGPSKILYDLKQKGIEETTILSQLGDYKLSLMKENISSLIEKKIKTTKNKPINKMKEAVTSFLINRGYDYGLIKEMLELNAWKFQEMINEEALLKKDYNQYSKKYEKTKQTIPFKEYILGKLMQKGYNYHSISKLIEGE